MTSSHPAPARILTLRPPTQQQPPSRMPLGHVQPTRPKRREPLWRNIVGDVLRQERLRQQRTLKDVAESARISMPYLSEVERGRKEASSEVLAAAAAALGMRLVDLLERAQGELTKSSADADLITVTQVTLIGEASTRHTDLGGDLGRVSSSVTLAA